MYRILIVDDEKMARDSTFEILAGIQDLELEILTAPSAVQAQEIFSMQRIDVAILDINMPRMSGIDLYRIICEKWPQCKLIFLTAYSDFNYVYQVNENAQYILKAEDDAKLIRAVHTAVSEIEDEMMLSDYSQLEEDNREMAEIYRNSSLLRELFSGARGVTEFMRQIQAQKTALDFDRELYPVFIRLSEPKFSVAGADARPVYDIFNRMLKQHFLQNVPGMICYCDRDIILLLLQSSDEPRKLVGRLAGYADMFADACLKNTGRGSSFLILTRPVMLKKATRIYSDCCNQFLGQEDGDIQLIEPERISGSHNAEGEREELGEAQKQAVQRAILKAERALHENEPAQMIYILQSVKEKMRPIRNMNNLFGIETYHSLTIRIMSAIDRLDIQDRMEEKMSLTPLYNISSFNSWEKAYEYLELAVNEIYAMREEGNTRQHENMIRNLKQYIDEHLDGDTSICALAGYTHFSQEHLQRVFRSEEGITILTYINNRKIEEAKRMLREDQVMVKDAAEKLGFSNVGYFIHFFREKVGVTPHAWQSGSM